MFTSPLEQDDEDFNRMLQLRVLYTQTVHRSDLCCIQVELEWLWILRHDFTLLGDSECVHHLHLRLFPTHGQRV